MKKKILTFESTEVHHVSFFWATFSGEKKTQLWGSNSFSSDACGSGPTLALRLVHWNIHCHAVSDRPSPPGVSPSHRIQPRRSISPPSAASITTQSKFSGGAERSCCPCMDPVTVPLISEMASCSLHSPSQNLRLFVRWPNSSSSPLPGDVLDFSFLSGRVSVVVLGVVLVFPVLCFLFSPL